MTALNITAASITPPPLVTGPILDADYAIEGVPDARSVFVAWRRAWELLGPAVDRFPVETPWTSAAACHAAAIGDAQLWIAYSWQRRRIEGAVFGRILNGPDLAPNNRVYECPLVGGEHMSEWGGRMFGMIRDWATAQGCDYLTGFGRRGWIKLFGFQEFGKTKDGLPVLALPLKRVKEH